MSYLDLRELASELEALREQAVTCPTCKGEGTVEVEGPGGTAIDEPCDVCEGDGEYIPDGDEAKLRELPEVDAERLSALLELDGELGGLEGYALEEPTAIPESEFENYARELAENIGAIGDDNQWPLYCIDWERAARDLAMDYSTFDFEGVAYYVRSY